MAVWQPSKPSMRLTEFSGDQRTDCWITTTGKMGFWRETRGWQMRRNLQTDSQAAQTGRSSSFPDCICNSPGHLIASPIVRCNYDGPVFCRSDRRWKSPALCGSSSVVSRTDPPRLDHRLTGYTRSAVRCREQTLLPTARRRIKFLFSDEGALRCQTRRFSTNQS